MIDPAARAVLRAAAAHVVVADVHHPAIDEPTAHHLFRVLRVRDGDPVTVTDGHGRWRACRAAGGELLADVETTAAAARSATTTVAFAIPKSDRPEWIVQKLTELGVARIVLLHAERSVVRWEPDRAARHVAKLRRAAVEALEQSRGVWLPDIVGPVRAVDVLPGIAVAEPEGRPLTRSDDAVAVGPEGGWAPNELEVAGDRVSLGATVLRVETAALVAGALLTVRD
ncbi:MAG TPA: RsmE family RNA methyltransferase [Ilumatobacter sp.]